jgi:TonB family protein
LSNLESQPAIFVFEGPGCQPCDDGVDEFNAAANTLTGSSAKAFRVFIGDAAVAPPGTTLVSTAEQAERLGLQILPATVPVSPDGRIGRITEGASTAAQTIRLAEDVRIMPTEDATRQKAFVMVGQGGVVAPVLISKAPVVLSAEQRKLKIRGTVVLAVRVSSEGSVYDVFVQRSLQPDLDAAAVEAVRHWTFKPGTRDGIPVNVGFSINIDFK